jgi:hypothetical protein
MQAIQTDLEKLQLEFAKRSLAQIEAGQQKILDLQERKAAFETLAAQHACERAEAEKLVSAKTNERLARQAGGILRPTTTMRPELRRDGDEWTATYGALTARGPTPETACLQFDRIWLGKDEL